MKNSAILYVLLFLCLWGCKKRHNENALTTQIKLSEAPVANKTLDDFIVDVNYIKLETTEESLLGVITKLEITNDRIYALDQLKTNALFVFNKQGKFIYKVGEKGNGPGEYRIVTDFFIDENRETIHLLADGRKIVTFDMNGKYISEQQLPLLHCSYILPFSSNYTFINLPSSGDSHLIYTSDQYFNIIAKALKTPKGWEKIAILPNIGYSKIGDKYLFSYTCSNTIYELNEDVFMPKYNFVVPDAVKLTERKLGDMEKLDNKQFLMEILNCFSFDTYFEFEKSLFVEFSMDKNNYFGFYNKENKTFEYYERNNAEKSFPYPVFLSNASENILYGIITSDMLPENNEFSVTEDSNPLIGLYKIKD